jgi:transposase
METIYHIGLDQHKKFSQVAVTDNGGKVKENTQVENTVENIREFFEKIPRTSIITMEATGDWYWMYDLLEDLGFKVKLAHPRKVRLIAEAAIKTDKIDCVTLAQLERTNFLPESYVPTKEVRDLRELMRHRCSLVGFKTSLKNKVHALLAKRGIRHEFLTDIFGKAGREFLGQTELPVIYRLKMDTYMKLIDQLQAEAKALEKIIKEKAIKEDKYAKILLTIPGISYISAMFLSAEIADINRFKNYKKLCSYAGLASSTDQSAEKMRHGHIIKESNRYIRTVLVEAVYKAMKQDPHLAQKYYKLAKRRGNNKAKIAIARKMLVSIYFMLKENKPYKIRGIEGNKSKNYIINDLELPA